LSCGGIAEEVVTVTLAVEDLTTLAVNKVVDARGTSCPGPILAAKKGIADVAVGGIMEVMSTDSGTLRDLPAWAKKVGHDYLGALDEAGYLRLFIKKAR
jgi:tRNA 2-thiouridine synthesizing protein A